MIKNISIEKLDPHPDNPRKDLGDLAELAESIKAKGVLQNLTVVPHQQEENGYRIVIGHRRCAAAKLAGLTELPCTITEMTPQEQVATMLLENMQRVDLTIYEQAKGIQMMIDFGESVEGISEKTGLSGSTVRRRVKLLEFDEETFKETAHRNPTLADYEELIKIKDLERRNRVLKKIGTPEFEEFLEEELSEQECSDWMVRNEAILQTFATKIERSEQDKYLYYSYKNGRWSENDFTPPENQKINWFYIKGSNDFKLFCEKEKATNNTDEAAQKREEEERERLVREGLARELTSKHAERRWKFALRVSNKVIKENMHEVALLSTCSKGKKTLFLSSLDGEIKEDRGINIDIDIEKEAKANPERLIFLSVYFALDRCLGSYFGYRGQHWQNKGLDDVYEFLAAFGYKPTREEKEVMNGTHELFMKEETDEEL